ncbi:MAG: metallophosphoesterase [Sphaerochaetaceae bacterium]|nr:metallophosphoesterase [Sphaerochaetaceae bacterium]
MKRLSFTLIIILSLLFLSCENSISDTVSRFLETSFSDPFKDVTTNTFLSDKGLVTAHKKSGNDFSFVIITDAHFGGSGNRGDDAFITWLDDGVKNSVDFVVSLGDQSNYSNESEFQDYINTIVTPVENMSLPMISLMGNHDSVNGGLTYYKSLLGFDPSFFMFTCKNVEFYVFDSSLRTLGTKQLEYFEEAMATSSTKKRVVLSHVPVYGGTSTLWGTLYDSYERARILQAYFDGGVSLSLSGHVHVGIDPFALKDDCYEYVLKSFIGQNANSDYPRWYLADYDADQNVLTITCYVYKDSAVSSAESFSFTL